MSRRRPATVLAATIMVVALVPLARLPAPVLAQAPAADEPGPEDPGDPDDLDDVGSIEDADRGDDPPDVELPDLEPETWTVDGPVRVAVDPGGVLRLGDGRRFLDTLELRGSGGSPTLVNELSMDDYVTGLAEMPTRWPLEALKAQAVAARTYAWRAQIRGTWDGYDICATVACQVFRGADVVLDSPTGHRWREAVYATSGQVLVDADGQPILARYFSTSGGRTYANEEVFASDGAFDYLVGIDDPFDAVSPLHRWSVRFTRAEFDAILARGTRLSATVPVAAVERIGEIDDPTATIRVTGRNGRQVEVGAVAFRDFVSQVSATLYPDRFPGPTDDGDGTLPTTMPSSRFAIEIDDDEVVVLGQGWGHGVGMGQFGAMGRAEDGASYDEILATYYNGLAPTAADGVPDRVRVGMGLSTPVRIGGDTFVQITSGETVVVERGLGTFEIDAGDGRWVVIAPVGHGDELWVSGTRAAVGVPTMRDAATVEIDVNKPVLLTLEVTGTSGTRVLTRSLGVAEAGTHAATWRFDTSDGQPVEPGDYRIVLTGQDHTGATAGTPMTVTVPDPPPPPVPPLPPGEETADARVLQFSLVAALLGALGLLLIAGALLARGRR
jgi:SpoIID/LytB domain protein